MRKQLTGRVSLAVLAAATLTLALVPVAVAAPDSRDNGKGGGGGGRCTQKAPGVYIDNNWAWGASGSYGMPGQQLTYAIDVFNYDVGCSSSSFAVSVSSPSGFSVSLPTSSIRLKSGSSGYLYAYVTSPSPIADGDYPLSATVQRASSGQSASATSWYKAYSSDSAAPTLFWPSPGNGATITRGSNNVAVWASDDHSVKRIDLMLDNAYVATTACDNVTYNCGISYTWSATVGQHTATFTAYDWMGNASTLSSAFTVT
jgi:hypothetical protein